MTDETKPTLAMKSKEEIINELIEAIKPLKIESPTKKHEKFVNVGIEAVIRLFNDNKAVIEQSIEVYATQQKSELQQEVDRLKLAIIEIGNHLCEGNYIAAHRYLQALNPQQDETGR